MIEFAALVARLRAAGCVFAEDEARILLESELSGAALLDAVARREAGEPLEHLVGRVDFGGVPLAIGPGVFVPRARSVFLARRVVSELRGVARPVFVEAYAGCAPLAAYAVAAGVEAEVHVIDVDETALEYVARNVPAARICRGDGLTGLSASLRGRVSLICAVPPYVPDAEIALMPGEARDHEPDRSRRGGVDGLDHVRRLAGEARDWLCPGGVLLCELHRDQAPGALEAGRRLGYDATATTSDDRHTTVARFERINRSPP